MSATTEISKPILLLQVVIKEIDMAKMPSAEQDAALQEARVLMSLDHPNIVKCHESFVDDRCESISP